MNATSPLGAHYEIHYRSDLNEWRWERYDPFFEETMGSCTGTGLDDGDWVLVTIQGAGSSTTIGVYRSASDPDGGGAVDLASWAGTQVCTILVGGPPIAFVDLGNTLGLRAYAGLSTADELARDLFVECPIAHPSMVVRAEAYRRVGGYRRRGWPEDYDLVLRLHARGMRMGNVPELLLHWRVTPARLSARSEAYSPAAFRRCKVHFLRTFVPEGRRLVVWGAGKVGKGFARELVRQGHEIEAFVELDPRKIGQRLHGAPVVEPAALSSRFRRSYVLIAVGSPGARREIREALCELGFEELRDYRAVA